MTRVLSAGALAVCLLSSTAWAVPSFARQTGMSCSACHTVFPELTPFGREFKAGGYTMSTTKELTEGGDDGSRQSLELPVPTPLGLMLLAGFTHTWAPQQVAASGPPARNDDIALPQQFSVFFAGKVAPGLGAFVQLTYDGVADHLGFDNTDIRYAHTFDLGGKPLTVGATVNNGPTVSDLWNSTPAWGVPFAGSASAPAPSAAPLIAGALAQASVGAGAYAFFNGLLYGEVDVYRSAPLGVSLPLDASTGATNVIGTVAPYWRLAAEKTLGEHTVSLGTFGLAASLWPGGPHPLGGAMDRYVDVGVDSQYQYIGKTHIITGTLTYIHESQALAASQGFGAADIGNHELHDFKASASYIYSRLVGARLTFSTMRGTSDGTWYGGSPRSTSFTGELFVTPWQNVKLGLQYSAYLDFMGATGADAAGNDTLYAYTWLAF